MPPTTRAAIRQEAHDRLYTGARTFRRLRNGPDASGLTEFSDNATTIVDTALKEVAALPNDFFGAWIRLKYVDNSSVTQERVSRIHQFDPDTGTVTYSPAIGTVHATAGTVNGEYEIWPDVHPDEADKAMNRILEDMTYKTVLPVTQVQDGDMEDPTATLWTDIGTPTSKTKAFSTLTFPFGRQYLALTANDGIGASIQNVPTTPSEQFLISVVAKVQGGTWDVTFYDATAAAVIKTTTIGSDTVPLEIRYTDNAPSSCVNVTLRFVSNSSGASIRIATASLRSIWRDRYILDSTSSTFPEDIVSVFSIPQGQSLQVSDTYLAQIEKRIPEAFTIEGEERGNSPLTLVVENTSSPLYMEALQRFPTFSADSDTTAADRDTVVNGTLYYLERARGNDAREYLRTFHRLRELQGYGPKVVEQSDRQLLRFR